MRYIILAAGKGERWENYLGIPKQLIEINGEKLIFRTIRLLKERGITDIVVTVPRKGYFGDLGIEEYEGKDTTELDKFSNCEEILNERAVLLWGDTYFTEEAIDKIVSDKNDHQFFGRRKPSSITGKPYCEVFAVKMDKWLLGKVKELDKIRGNLSRCGSWELYKFVHGEDLKWIGPDYQSISDSDFTEIDDLTEDFDKPIDYDNFIKKIQTANEIFNYMPKHEKVLHVGGHLGQEASYYRDVIYVEPIPEYAEKLRQRGFKVIEGAIGGDELKIMDYDQASSIYNPKHHKIVKTIKVKQYNLREIESGCDVLVLDIQGAELEALKTSNLNFKYIILEASNSPRYEGASSKTEIEQYLEKKGFKKVKELQHQNYDIFDILFKRI